MAWIDSTRPLPPILSYDSSGATFFTTSIDLYFRDSVKNDLLNRYVIYQFNHLDNLDQNDPKNIKEIILSGNNFYHFSFDNIPSSQNQIIIAATALTKTNNESDLTRYIYLERKANGWQIVDQTDNK
jgi:hypothetical protein